MDIRLKATDDELKTKFYNLKTLKDIASLLEVDMKTVVYLVYRKDPSSTYHTFEKRKRSGGIRVIDAPISSIKILQQKLNYILLRVYQPKPCVHGFLNEKSVLTNSQTHVRKYYILNIDLEDFFPSINFGRVRGMFMAKPYSLPNKAATVLAKICCFDNRLPQGGPTSPIISNMICAMLDSQLIRLAKNFHCSYTRYADDITFSTTNKTFPTELATFDDSGRIVIGRLLDETIRNNGFKINQSKIRLQDRCKSQEVTGLIVNKFPNVKRTFIRQIRAMLNAWAKYGLEAAQKEYEEKYLTKQINPSREPPKFKNVVQGKINYLKMVKGDKDGIYRKLALRFNELIGKDVFPKYFDDPIKEISSALWILESETECKQGTGFMLERVGMVTCSHVVCSDTYAFQYENATRRYPVRIITNNTDYDIAILLIEADNLPALKIGDSSALQHRSKITVAGFPNYRLGDKPYISDGFVTSFRTFSAKQKMLISVSIVAGNSGGPVLNTANEVIGIAVTGADNFEKARETEDHGVIPIDYLGEI